MNTTEKLQQIRAKCVELLAIAEKRTPGNWIVMPYSPTLICTNRGHHVLCGTSGSDIVVEQDNEHNAIFIAACAGNFEAALRNTIAAIDELFKAAEFTATTRQQFQHKASLWAIADAILTAWPDELLK